MILKIAIVDDEAIITKQMDSILIKICQELEVDVKVDLFESGKAAILALSQEIYHLVFLDIEMGECSGIEVSRYIRDSLMNDTTQIVYVSGKHEYDRLLFEFRPFHFLAKPINKKMVWEVIRKYIRVYMNTQDLYKFRQGHDTSFVKLDSILYFESIGRKIKIKTTTEELFYYGSLQQVLEQLHNKGFFSPHKSFVVNYLFVKTFQPSSLILTNNEYVPISKSRRIAVSKMQLEIESGGYGGEF